MARPALADLLPGATPALCNMLDPSRGAVQPPIRSEIFGAQRFAQHGVSLGATHRAEAVSIFAATFFPRLKSNIQVLREAHRYIGVQASTGYDISPAAEWLLDNFHTIEAQLKEIHEGLPRSYFRSLPVLQDEPLAGLPRVYGVAWAFVAHTDGAFDEALLAHFLTAYQEVRELKLSEVWAMPTTLRVVLIENLRRLAERVATNKAAREVANICFDRIDSYDADALDELLTLLTLRGVGRVFLAQMAQRLQDRRTAGDDNGQTLVQSWLRVALPDLGAMQIQQSADQAQDNLSVSNAVMSLRAIGDADWSGIIARTSALMQLMLTSPLFSAEDDATRDQTLHAIEKLARRSGQSEVSVARALLRLMQTSDPADGLSGVAHHWLRGAGQAALMQAIGLPDRAGYFWQNCVRRLVLPAYLLVLCSALSLLVWWLLHHGGGTAGYGNYTWLTLVCVAAMLFPASEAVVAVVNRLISESARPQHLPRLALLDGIPPEHRVLVVIPGMLTTAAATQELVHHLELHYLANPESEAQFALLTDWADADTPQLSSDGAMLALAQEQMDALNRRHPRAPGVTQGTARFVLLHRHRSFSESEQRWIGWERKRGKLEQLVTALATDDNSSFLDLGVASQLTRNTRYIVTLDSDTLLPSGRLRELVSVAAHPHNEPRLDTSGRKVVSGYCILQPRIETPLPTAELATPFHWLFAGQCGIDPYSAASSEVYQDLFGEGTFTGKGLLHVQTLHAVLTGRLPEGQILSHDLLEGSLARCATVTDLSVIEDAPFHADVAAARVHRWTRGDWQLLPVLAASVLRPRQYGIRAVNLWKMLDNLRRSLVAPLSLVFLLTALAGSSVSPWIALALVFLAFSVGPLMGALAGFSPRQVDLAKTRFFVEAAVDLGRALAGGLWHVAQLVHQSLLAGDAITRALHRTFISRRQLLQWTTAAAAQSSAKTTLEGIVRLHWLEPATALALLVGLLVAGTPYPGLALGLCLVWGGSPVWIWWASRPRPPATDAQVTALDAAYLHGVARDTWRLFERCVGPDDKHLPPDNLQLSPHDIVAHRTSPTNIGMYLLSVACARKFGWIGTQDMLNRLQATLATLMTLERHRGHFLNWYDTQSGAPLLPTYVSTVDSGNLSGHLLALGQACLDLAHAPLDGAAGQRAIAHSRARMAPLLALRSQLPPQLREELRWMLADHRNTLRSAAMDETLDAVDAAHQLRALARAFTDLAWEADYTFLYHGKRRLFHIGYRVAERQRDSAFYDLLASESRLTSLLAIAKGDVPVRHWAALGRPFFAVGTSVGLRSWTGSMFEYLMPSLVLAEPQGSVLQAACHAALREQMSFTRAQGLPWGVSESAYAASDHTLAYQYAPQGVPRLALRRTPVDELVIAPYATALVAQIAPRSATQNFRILESLGARGRYGFIDALDYSPARRVDGKSFTAVDTVMAHHQGMSIVSLANTLLHGIAQRWGMANASMESVASLLHEPVPRAVSLLYAPPPASRPVAQQRRRVPSLLRPVVPGAAAVEPTHLLSNGRYSVSLRANGAGWSRWGQTGITRQRDDALRDDRGSFFYLRWDQQRLPVSLTQHPAPDPHASYRSVFHADRVCFDATWADIHAQTTVWVSPEDDIEFRRVELRNDSDRTLDIELISAFEPTLADRLADEAHPAFTSLFVRAEWLVTHQSLLLERKPRLPTEQGLQAAHFLTTSDARILGTSIQTDRQRWLGRNHCLANPLASLDPLPLTTAETSKVLATGLDPMCALAVQVRIAPNARIQLTFATAVADNGATLRAVIDKYRLVNNVKRSSLMSATLMGIRLRSLRISADNFAAMQTLTTAMVLTLTRPSTRPPTVGGVKPGVCDRRLLWRFGVSGDRPLILVSAGVLQGLGLLRVMAQALNFWAWGGIACDLVVVNSEPASYDMPLQREIAALRDRHLFDTGAPQRPAVTGFVLLRANELSADELSTLKAHARVRLHADGRPLAHHVQEWMDLHGQAMAQRQARPHTRLLANDRIGLTATAPKGEFLQESGEFAFAVSAGVRTLRPWINVLSNPHFGAQISEAGGGYTWALNSRLNQLTAWSNDPVADPPAEWFLVQDLKTQQIWSVTPNAWGAEGSQYQIRHGQGYSVISHHRAGLEISARWCVDPQTAVKQVSLVVVNHGLKAVRLRVVGMAEWMMGANRADRGTVQTDFCRQPLPNGSLSVLMATQRERAAGFGDGTAFLSLAGGDEDGDDWTCDRRECFDMHGHFMLPGQFGRRSGLGLDPCAALASRMDVGVGASAERVFLLGYAENADAALALATAAAAVPTEQRTQLVHDTWNTLLGATVVSTPDPLFDAMVNRWLLYQTVTCRLWAKAGFYQAGGATGFRDQLQDAMALAWAAPKMLRDQIVLCASRQFEQGDVQHWWHAPVGAGVRTHFSDDLLWLPYACTRYVRATGDATLLEQEVPFLEGAAIPEGAEDAYYTPGISAHTASVYEHAARAIDHSLRVGVHGLPLMGSGDWNDGMNRVGIEGRGESVWLAWFLCRLVADFVPLAAQRGDTARVLAWQTALQGWRLALQGPAWDGRWFKRAFFDNGEPLGSSANAEARIDLIAQSWAVLSGAAPQDMQSMALSAMDTELVDADQGLIKLLDPPFSQSAPSPGYIQAYPPGVRENGGQYSHAGVWALMAQAARPRDAQHPEGGGDTPYRYFTYLSPAHRASHLSRGLAYGIEPYAMAGDVYSQPPYVGRGGWSWYTGAAAWLHRAAVESIFGLQLGAQELVFQPCLPAHWDRAEMRLVRGAYNMRFVFLRANLGDALAATTALGAQALRPGQALHWTDLEGDSCFVIPLLAE
ncbi:MAG: glucoamylase family protein [Pseudomonadota bacterium]